jgi:hypothetical protein
VILTAVLLGVPRALDARAFGSTRSVYVEVADPSPGLAGFAEELSRALEGAGCPLAARPTGATVVVEVYALWKRGGADTVPAEAIGCTVRDAHGRRPLVLDYRAGCQAQAARAVLRVLDEASSSSPRPGPATA